MPFGHLIQTVDSLEKTLGARKARGQKEKGAIEDEMVGWHHDSMDMNLSKLWKIVKDREAWHAVVHKVTKSWPLLSD